MRWTLMTCVGFCVAALTGCISGSPPTIQVVGVQLVEQSPEGARLEVSLLLRNPNGVVLPLPKATYTVSVEGSGSYSSIDLPSRVIAPNDSQSITLPAAIKTDGQSLVGRTWKAHGSVTYNLDNAARAFLSETGVPLPIALFSGSGVLE